MTLLYVIIHYDTLYIIYYNRYQKRMDQIKLGVAGGRRTINMGATGAVALRPRERAAISKTV